VTSEQASVTPVGAADEVAPAGLPVALVGAADEELLAVLLERAGGVLAGVGELLHAASSRYPPEAEG
jgi:hypothetical protein